MQNTFLLIRNVGIVKKKRHQSTIRQLLICIGFVVIRLSYSILILMKK